MRIVVTGSHGQLVQSLKRAGTTAGHEVVSIGRPQLDLAGKPGMIIDALTRASPDVIVSAAAHTAVDLAEDEPEQAEAINARGAAAVAEAARVLTVPLLHLSTDYVFDGSKSSPYREDDLPNPISVYGRTKLAGEQAVLAAHDQVVVLRTAWVYSPFGRNFIKTMLNLAKDRPEVRVVFDQIGNPTSALDIAAELIKLAAGLAGSKNPDRFGIFHLAAPDEANWAEFAQHIFRVSGRLAGPSATVIPITTDEFPTRAKRPANSRLDCSRIWERHGVILPSWRESSANVVGELLGQFN